MAATPSRVLVLRHHEEDHAGLIGEAFERRGFALTTVMVNEATPTPVVDGYDVLLILGSKSAVYDHEVEQAWFGRERTVMDRAQELGIPIFGICFGAQALCLHHGGTVTESPSPEIGWYEVTPEPGALVSAGPWFEFHYDRCVLPDEATLWATTGETVQAFCVGRNVGVQFHPEIDDEQLSDWMETGASDAREFGHDVDALIARTASEVPAARARADELVGLFLTHAFAGALESQ